MATSKYQAFDTVTIHRSQIKNAPYNPRIMDEGEKKRLRAGIKAHGLVAALTWNERSGNLVGGHQRLEQLDALEKTQDYELTVCRVDVDEKEEATLNVQLNNPSMQGHWDLDKLANLTTDFDLNLDDLGFTQADADFLFDGDDRFSELYENPTVDKTKDTLNEIKAARKESAEKMKEKGRADFYAMIVFDSPEARELFFKEISVPQSERFLTVEQIRRAAAARSSD